MSHSDWFETLSALSYLGLEDQSKILGLPLSRYKSGRWLVEPKMVYNFNEIVVANQNTIPESPDHFKLYDVLTREADDGEIEVVGKRWDSIIPYKWKGPKESVGENFMILKHSQEMIKKMLKNRVDRVKAGIR